MILKEFYIGHEACYNALKRIVTCFMPEWTDYARLNKTIRPIELPVKFKLLFNIRSLIRNYIPTLTTLWTGWSLEIRKTSRAFAK